MPHFQIEFRYDLKNRSYEYFETDGDEQERACEIAENLGYTLPRIMVREYDQVKRRRIKNGREFIIVFKQYNVTLSTGRIISEQWYQPVQWGKREN